LPRLAVILFQWEIAGQKDEGVIRVMRQVSRLLDTAEPSDRFAVLGFGSSLRLLADFTPDHAVVRRAVERVRSLHSPIFRSPDGEPSLAAGIGRCESTDSIEKALTCVGRTLQDLAGPKTLLFCGWAAESHRASWRTDYPSIVEAVSRAHASVFVLDVSSGAHRLEAGLRVLANDTGGTYNATFDFPDLARLRIQRALEGAYEVVFRSPGPGRGWHSVEIELVNASGTAVFPRWYND
jgi:hypothetical protein